MGAATGAAGEPAGVVGVCRAEGCDGAGGVAAGERCGCCDIATLVGDGAVGVCVVLCCVVVGAAA